MKNSSATWRIIAIGQCILSVTFAAIAAAPIINIDPSNPLPYWGFEENHGNGMVGWTFQLLQPFTVTQVGWYDADSDGLSRDFQVGLWKGEADTNTNNSATPKFVSGVHYSSLIGDPDKGLTIPSGTNASLNGFWRVVDLEQPLLLQPGFYELGGPDSTNTTDVIRYVAIGPPTTPTPFGAPLWVGAFFYAWPSSPVSQEGLQPTSNFYLYWGLELGPMLFGTVSTQNLQIRPCLIEPSTPGISLTWSTGTLWEADEVAGPYTVVTNATSPFAVPTSSCQRFYRLQP